jgi:hypothetical protein
MELEGIAVNSAIFAKVMKNGRLNTVLTNP